MDKLKLVVGIDPSSGSTSPVGFAVFIPETREVVYTEAIHVKKNEFRLRIKEISARISELMLSIDPDAEVTVYIEKFVMAGKPGEMLARASGAIIAALPANVNFDEVQNTTVKKIVGSNGRADKLAVAKGVHTWFGSQPLIEDAIQKEQWDILDALAIGLTGWLREQQQTFTD
jgi:Holliday junction resolvasome RuvABC endonuclease subunit